MYVKTEQQELNNLMNCFYTPHATSKELENIAHNVTLLDDLDTTITSINDAFVKKLYANFQS